MLSENTGCSEMTTLENLASNLRHILGDGKWVWESDPGPQLDRPRPPDGAGYLGRMYGVVGRQFFQRDWETVGSGLKTFI